LQIQNLEAAASAFPQNNESRSLLSWRDRRRLRFGHSGISAARFGLGPVVGFDNDPIAVRVSREKRLAQSSANRTGFLRSDLSTGLADRQAGLVLANIRTDVLRQGARALVGRRSRRLAGAEWNPRNELNDFRADFLAVAEGAAVIHRGKAEIS